MEDIHFFSFGFNLSNISFNIKTNGFPHHHPGLLAKGCCHHGLQLGQPRVIGSKVTHTHCKVKAKAKRDRQSSDSDPALTGLFQIETSRTLLMLNSNDVIHIVNSRITFPLFTLQLDLK